MGHFNTIVRGAGKDRREAQQVAVQEFLHEHGHRHDVRDITPLRMIRKVPPHKWVQREAFRTVPTFPRFGGSGSMTEKIILHEYAEDATAPQSEWLEEWEFDLHTHA